MNRRRHIIALLACALPAVAAEPYSKLRADGPKTLLIAYRCNPDQKTALRLVMLEGGGVAKFETWKDRGVLAEYRVLFTSYLDSEAYDMFTLLTFADYAAVDKWREVEKHFPGGLAPEALRLIASAVTYPLDAVRHGASQTPPVRGRSV